MLRHNEVGFGRSIMSLAGGGIVSVDRFATLLYGIGEAAGYLSIPPSTLTGWAYGYERRRPGTRAFRAGPIITAVRQQPPGAPAVPFIGLAEGVCAGRVPRRRGSLAAHPAGYRCPGP